MAQALQAFRDRRPVGGPGRWLTWPSRLLVFLALVASAFAPSTARAAGEFEPLPPRISLGPTNGGALLDWTRYPAAESYQLLAASVPEGPYAIDPLAPDIEPPWLQPNAGSNTFFRLTVTPLDTNTLWGLTLLQRIAYGPTPDELPRVRALGPEAYLEEQLAPELLVENLPHHQHDTNVGWQYVTATGPASATQLYIYLNKAGEGFLDDVKLVAGTVPEAGENLLRNGDFEAPLNDADWLLSPNLAASEQTTAVAHGGAGALHLRSTEGGGSRSSVITQNISPEPVLGRTYTLSYWWLPSTNDYAPVTVRFAGAGLASSPGTLGDKLDGGGGTIADLRSWHLLNAIHSRRQLLEVLLQFFENHFVTEVSKTEQYLNSAYPLDGEEPIAAELEYKELNRWRAALLNPLCTFHDLLRISAESPSMIIYLDTVNNRATRGNIANENYARELLELFTFGVDNGYEQKDIEEMANVWTGWTVRYVRPDQEGNPFAPRSDLVRPGGSSTSSALIVTNLLGVWSFAYQANNHSPDPKYLFYQYDANGERLGPKVYPARFGPALAGQPYALTVDPQPGTNGMSEGYAVLAHLANQPFTQEFIAVKLCRLLVHDDFQHGVYDYTLPELSPEAALVKACMESWNASEPKGQIRPVLRTILTSDLFRRHGASLHKIRTPLEFGVAAIRALLAERPEAPGTYTAVADPVALQTMMRRAGEMNLFDRENPDGYPETGPPWISAGTISERLRFVQAYLMPLSYGAKATDAGTCYADPVALVQSRLPADHQRDAAAVADLFVSLLYPAEGHANLGQYRQLAEKFLNTSDDGQSGSPFAALSAAGNPSPYEIRLRATVAMLMTLPRMHEQ